MQAGKTEFECGTFVRITKSDDPDLIGATGFVTHPFPGIAVPRISYIAGLRIVSPVDLYGGDICNLTDADVIERVT